MGMSETIVRIEAGPAACCEVLNMGRGYRVCGENLDGVKMEGFHRIRCCMPNGTTELLFLAKGSPPVVFENVTVHDLSGNGRDWRGLSYSAPRICK